LKRKNISSNPSPSLFLSPILPLPKGKGEVRREMGLKTSPSLILPLQRRGRKGRERRGKEKEGGWGIITTKPLPNWLVITYKLFFKFLNLY